MSHPDTPGSPSFDSYFGQNLKLIRHEDGAMPGLERALERMAGSDKSVSTCQASLRELQEAAGGRSGMQPDSRLHHIINNRDSHCSNDTLLKQLKVHNQITIQV